MPRIPEEQIERLKAEVSLERLAEARGIALKRHGADLIASASGAGSPFVAAWQGRVVLQVQSLPR